jgi:hypothetical protein
MKKPNYKLIEQIAYIIYSLIIFLLLAAIIFFIGTLIFGFSTVITGFIAGIIAVIGFAIYLSDVNFNCTIKKPVEVPNATEEETTVSIVVNVVKSVISPLYKIMGGGRETISKEQLIQQKGLLKDIEDFSEESAQIAADIKLINELTCRSIDELQAQVRKLKERLDILRSRVGESTRTVGARKSEKSSDYSEYKVLQSQMLELMERGKRYQALDIPPSVTTFTSIKIQEIRTQIKDQSTARREIHRQIIAIASQMLDIDDIAIRERAVNSRKVLEISQ